MRRTGRGAGSGRSRPRSPAVRGHANPGGSRDRSRGSPTRHGPPSGGASGRALRLAAGPRGRKTRHRPPQTRTRIPLESATATRTGASEPRTTPGSTGSPPRATGTSAPGRPQPHRPGPFCRAAPGPPRASKPARRGHPTGPWPSPSAAPPPPAGHPRPGRPRPPGAGPRSAHGPAAPTPGRPRSWSRCRVRPGPAAPRPPSPSGASWPARRGSGAGAESHRPHPPR